MSDAEWVFDPACFGKEKYHDHAAALRSIHYRAKRCRDKKKGRQGFRAYRCAKCGSWHVGEQRR